MRKLDMRKLDMSKLDIQGSQIGRLKKVAGAVAIVALIILLAGCGNNGFQQEKTEIIILAAASLIEPCGELEKIYEAEHKDVDLVFSFGGSGALQAQLQEGAPAHIFISAAELNMEALVEQGLVDKASVRQLFENQLVLITAIGQQGQAGSFADLASAENCLIAIGQPESVPAGYYARQVFQSLGIWEDVSQKLNYGSDVRTVLAWVEEGAALYGAVYATDAYSSDKVKILDRAPSGSCDRIVYPAGIMAGCDSNDIANQVLDFLEADEAGRIFEDYGFKII